MRFIIYGRPHGKSRPRHGRFNTYNPKTNIEYEKRVKEAYMEARGLHNEVHTGPMWINIECYYPIPRGTPKSKRQMMEDGKILPMVKPDLDNVAKSILDALNGLAFMDDKQIVILHTTKRYDATPRVVVDLGRQYT